MLFEDLLKTQFVGLEPLHDASNDSYWENKPFLTDVHYFNPEDVTNAYHDAAM